MTTDRTRLLELLVRLRGFERVDSYDIGGVVRLRIIDEKFYGHSFEKRKALIDSVLTGWSDGLADSIVLYLFWSLDEDRDRNDEFVFMLGNKS